jgi:hypothetical protein
MLDWGNKRTTCLRMRMRLQGNERWKSDEIGIKLEVDGGKTTRIPRLQVRDYPK